MIDALKSTLIDRCHQLVNKRHERILKTITDIENSLREESRSTSGDKHHTGRAMLHIDREYAGKQLSEIVKVKEQLAKVKTDHNSEFARTGSLIHTNNGIFFISISVGSVEIGNTIYLCIAPNSPIGILLLGKKEGDRFNFREKEYIITELN